MNKRGTWLNTSMYEIPTLAIVNEVYFRMAYNYDELLESFKKRLDEKYENLRSGHWYAGTFSEFGLRRRLSAEAQELAVEKFSHLNDTLHSPSKFVGTSNVYLAKKYNLTPVGTMAHEWIMCTGQGNHKHNPAYSNWYALDAWVKEYGVLNGIALTDTITTDAVIHNEENKLEILPGETAFIDTGIVMEIPNGYVGLVYARSGLSCKQGLAPANKVGVIDSDYRGNIMVALYNQSNEIRIVSEGDRIAQIIIQPVEQFGFKVKENLSDTIRGNGGFGSSGKA